MAWTGRDRTDAAQRQRGRSLAGGGPRRGRYEAPPGYAAHQRGRAARAAAEALERRYRRLLAWYPAAYRTGLARQVVMLVL